MYRVIIADDEESIRNRLKHMLEKLPDFELVGYFENGFDTLENGIALAPDILITDIRMPYVNGIDLIRQMKMELPLIQSIIISGYDSFDYAKEAISLGVIGYLTKPLSLEEFTGTMGKAKELLDRQSISDLNLKALEQKAMSSIRFLQSEDLNRLIKIKNVDENFKGKLLEDGINLDFKYQFFVIFDPDDEDPGFEQQDLLYYYLRKTVEENVIDPLHYYFFLNDNQYVLLLMKNDTIDTAQIIDKLTNIVAKIKKALKISVSCGVSDVMTDPINYRKIFRHAKRCLEYRTVFGRNMVFSFPDLEKENQDLQTNAKVDENEYRTLTYLLSYGKKEEARQQIEKLINQISSPEYRENYNYILSNILDAILKSCIALNDFYLGFDSHVEITSNLYNLKTINSVVEFYSRIANRVIQINESKRLSGLESSFERIVHYIESHFSDTSLSIDDVARELSYSVSYISAILKKNGTSFTKLTMEFRMKKAVDLLLDANNKVIVVAKEVGYSDPYYFSHCFKKYTGMSPDEYRKKHIA